MIVLSKKIHVDQNNIPNGDASYWFWCPGCNQGHKYVVGTGPSTVHWTFNGNMDKPSFAASLLQLCEKRCHLFVTDGRIVYCADCWHPLAGQTVDMVELPQWLR